MTDNQVLSGPWVDADRPGSVVAEGRIMATAIEDAGDVGLALGRQLKAEIPHNGSLHDLIGRLFESQGRTSFDALACLTVAHTILEAAVAAMPADDEDCEAMPQTLAINCLHLIAKSIHAMECETGIASESFTAEAQQIN